MRVGVFVGVVVTVMVVVVGVADFVEVLGFGVVVVFVGGLMCGFGGPAVLEDMDAGGGDSAAVDLLYLETGVEMERGGGVVEDFGVEAGVEESCEEHVAADAGEAVEVGDPHVHIVSRGSGRR